MELKTNEIRQELEKYIDIVKRE
ncbi:hypothetical protein EZS27_044170, partial [termite gut metagenome]